MKKIFSLMFIVTLVSVYSSAIAQTPKALITKKWVFKEVDKKDLDTIIAKAVDQMKDQLNEITDPVAKKEAEAKIKESTATMGDQFTGMMKDLEFNFLKDGTYMVSGMGVDAEKGTWVLSADGKKLTTTSDKGKTETIGISKLTATELIFHLNTDGISMHITLLPGL